MKKLLLFCAALFVVPQLYAEFPYTISDLGTLGGNSSSASGLNGQAAANAAGMIVGTSNASDNSDHAFLWLDGRIYDLNSLCDLTGSGFKVLTSAKSINDSGVIIGEGITATNQKHAFIMTPTKVDGGQWRYACCQWVWIQDGGGWWWETDCHCYKWHGPPGDHPPCPPNLPHCWWPPLFCPPGCYDCPPPNCFCCINGEVVETSAEECRARGGVCAATPEEAKRNCQPRQKCWICLNGTVIEVDASDPRVKEARQCFNTREEAQRYCGPQTCWVCLNGTAVQLSEAECKQRGGTTYRTREEALRNCQPPSCWICVNGKAVQMSGADCQQRHGYATPEEALRNCGGDKTGWCCGPNGVSQATRAQCAQYGGQWFATQAEAMRACDTPRPPLTYVPGATSTPRTSIPRQSDTPSRGRKPRKESTPSKGPVLGEPVGIKNPNGSQNPRLSSPPKQSKDSRRSKRGKPTPTPAAGKR